MLWRPHHLIRARTNFDFLGKRRTKKADPNQATLFTE